MNSVSLLDYNIFNVSNSNNYVFQIYSFFVYLICLFKTKYISCFFFLLTVGITFLFFFKPPDEFIMRQIDREILFLNGQNREGIRKSHGPNILIERRFPQQA